MLVVKHSNKYKKKRLTFLIASVFFLLFIVGTVVFAASDFINVTQEVIIGESSSGGGGSVPIIAIAPPVISDIVISDLTFNSVKINWKTNKPSSAELDYGKTPFCEIASLQDHEASLIFSHQIVIESLEEGTKYYFRVRSKNSNGVESSAMGSFSTLQTYRELANVSDLTTQSFNGRNVLNWRNVDDERFSGVQINKQIASPVQNQSEGEIVFLGDAEIFEDINVENGVKYYYTVFSYDNKNNFSSGVFVSVIGLEIITNPVNPPDIPDISVSIPLNPTTPVTPIPPVIILSDVENLETISDTKKKEIEIQWDLIEYDNFEEVEVYRSINFPILIPNGKEVIYNGKEKKFIDNKVELDSVYYYTVFTKDKSGNYSAGKVVIGSVEKIQDFVMDSINLDDFHFISENEKIVFSQKLDGKISTFPSKEISIYYDAENLPKTLKTIIATVGQSSYLFNIDEKNEFYRTKFISPNVNGSYSIVISVFDFEHSAISQEKIKLVVEDYGQVQEILSKTDYFILKIRDFLKIGKQKNGQSKGARVSLFSLNEEQSWFLWDGKKFNQKNPQITDLTGSFGFIVPNGKYKIVAEKDNYISENKIIEVKNNVINSKIEIQGENNWLIFIIVSIIFILILIIIYRKFKFRK